MFFKVFLLLCLVFPVTFINASLASTPILKIACSSNFVSTLRKIIKTYKKNHNVRFINIQGSSEKLTTQIIHGLPVDIFLSADKKHTKYLILNKITNKDFIYAIGQIVLLVNDRKRYASAKMYLMRANILHVSIANPLLSPYGAHGKKLLQNMDLWKRYVPKIVYGINISQTFNYVITKNVKAGFVAYSQIAQYEHMYGKLGPIRQVYFFNTSDEYILQYGVILNRTHQHKIAQKFIQYLLTSKKAQRVLYKMGYKKTIH